MNSKNLNMNLKMAAFTLLGAGLLSACSIVGTRSAAVSGQLRGFAQDQNLRLALVGFNSGKFTADGTRAQVIDKFLTGGYTLTLPRDVPNGTYRVVVFRDNNNNDRYDLADTLLSKDNGKLLVYAGRDNDPIAGVKYGWNIYNGPNSPVQTTVLTNYDLESAN